MKYCMENDSIKELWNELCFSLEECIKGKVLEKEYENAVIHCMTLLGWKKSRGEIKSQCPVKVGHETKYADVVILQDGIEQFVIEMKRPDHVLSKEDELQLFSYMRLLNHQVSFGLYIGEKICLYFDDVNLQGSPEQVFSVDISEDNLDGLKFVELFSKESFSINALSDFCKKQKSIMEEQKQMQEEVERLIKDRDGSIFKELLKRKYLEDGRSKQWMNYVLDHIDVSISKSVKKDEAAFIKEPAASNRKLSSKDATKYRFDGNSQLSKRRFVLEVITRFVKNNPCTYDEYFRILCKLRTDSFGIIQDLEKVKNDNNERCYFTKDDEQLTSKDGVIFVVCGEWRIDNIGPVVKFAEEQGYNIEVIPMKK